MDIFRQSIPPRTLDLWYSVLSVHTAGVVYLPQIPRKLERLLKRSTLHSNRVRSGFRHVPRFYGRKENIHSTHSTSAITKINRTMYEKCLIFHLGPVARTNDSFMRAARRMRPFRNAKQFLHPPCSSHPTSNKNHFLGRIRRLSTNEHPPPSQHPPPHPDPSTGACSITWCDRLDED